jgi:DNA-binding NarL/FixJ family response regulator
MRTDEQAENATRLSVVVCDDHPIVRHAMKIAVTEAPTLSLAAEPVPAADAVVELCKELRPDVCVIGINLGSRPHAIEATRAVRSASPSTKVLALSAYTNDETVLSAIEAGANGFIHKGEPVTSVLQAIVDVGRGRTVIDHDAFPDLVQRALRRRAARGELTARLEQLTDREREVFDLLRRGIRNGEIARRLVVSPRTIETHVQHILRKLDVHSELEAVALAWGVTGPSD